PALVYLLGQGAHDATTSSVLIVGVSSVVGFLARVRNPGLSWRTGLAFGAVGIPASYLGSLLNQRVSAPVLLLVFGAVVLVAAAAMLLNEPAPDDALDRPEIDRAGGGVAVQVRPDTARRGRLAGAVKVILCGSISGFLTGLLGVGGGFLVVPALVVVLRMPITLAIGTSLLIIVLNAGSAMAARVGDLHLEWAVVAPFTIAAVIGTVLGKKIADTCSCTTLTRAFAVMLVLVGGFVAVQSAVALLG
ncbi:MAG TPA: sulfite exporter TauE/SafE family protein, partial [Pseudonocardia sp.]|nr:sulfite exporter TauE/SafE family protein [Pseudonocardia sp.]